MMKWLETPTITPLWLIIIVFISAFIVWVILAKHYDRNIDGYFAIFMEVKNRINNDWYEYYTTGHINDELKLTIATLDLKAKCEEELMKESESYDSESNDT